MRGMKNILIIITGFVPLILLGQEVPFYSNYSVNPLIYNPANAGSTNNVEAFLNYRTQWVGMKGAPTSQIFTLSSPIESINSGIGISFQNDQRGLVNTISGSLKYAYHAQLNQQSKLSFGLGLDIQNRLLRIDESIVKDYEDPLLNKGSVSETFFDAAFGIEYHWNNKLTVGLGVPQILQGNGGSDSFVKNSSYFIGQTSYKFDVSTDLNVEPVVLVRYSQNIPIQYDVNGFVHYKDMFTVGLGYRNNYAINFHAGVSFKNFKVRYAYDFAAINSDLNIGLSHEIMLGYTFSKNKEIEIKQIEVPEETVNQQEPIKEEKTEEELSKEKINQILYILIDDYLEKSYRLKPEEKANVLLLRETIYQLLNELNK